MATKSNSEQLNEFLRGEMSAVETYQMALEKLDDNTTLHNDLVSNLRSHQDRVTMLRDSVIASGEKPADSSGPWGTWAKVVQGTAKLLGNKTAIAALEEGEDHGLKNYKENLGVLDPQWRDMVLQQLLPRQEETHARLSAIKHSMH